MGDICAGCSLVITMVRVYQFSFNHIITGFFCTPQKANVGMYSRCDYLVCVLDPAIPTSFFYVIQLFLYLFLFFFITLSEIYQSSCMVCSLLPIKWKMGGAQNSLPCPSLTCVHNYYYRIMTMNRMTKKAAGSPLRLSKDWDTHSLMILSCIFACLVSRRQHDMDKKVTP